MRCIFRAIMAMIFILPISASCSEKTWSPELGFSIDNLSQTESLTFISGIAYALEYSNKAIIVQEKQNFFCFDMKEIISLKLIIDLLNENLSGRSTAEDVMAAVVVELSRRFPCK